MAQSDISYSPTILNTKADREHYNTHTSRGDTGRTLLHKAWQPHMQPQALLKAACAAGFPVLRASQHQRQRGPGPRPVIPAQPPSGADPCICHRSSSRGPADARQTTPRAQATPQQHTATRKPPRRSPSPLCRQAGTIATVYGRSTKVYGIRRSTHMSTHRFRSTQFRRSAFSQEYCI